MGAATGSSAPQRSASVSAIPRSLRIQIDREAEVEPALDHGRRAVRHLPRAARAIREQLEHGARIEPARSAK
jgi:hypothetical protein